MNFSESLFLLPRGRPFGLPLSPGTQGFLSCFVLFIS